MKTTTCFKTDIGGMPISVTQTGIDRFTVTYWKQVKVGLNYGQAAHELGENIFHALACNSQLDNRNRRG